MFAPTCVCCASQKTLAYDEICSFPVKNEFVMFYCISPWAQNSKNIFWANLQTFIYEARVFVRGKSFKLNLMFASDVPFRCSNLGLVPGRTHKH
jgi:hypothetical protein